MIPTRTGTVISCNYDNYTYPSPVGGGNLYRHILIIQLKDGTIVTGKYDSQKLPQESFNVGTTVDFDTEEKVQKNGQAYLKFRKAKKPFPAANGGNDNPETRSQIERSVSVFCAIQCHKNELGKDVDLPTLINQMYTWIRSTVMEEVEKGSVERQTSINAQATLKLVCTDAPVLNITNMDFLWQSADKIFNYIHNG